MRTSTEIVFAVFILAPMCGLAQQPDFSGTWERNARLSQDPFEKIEMALGSEQPSGAGTKQYDAVNRGALLRDQDLATLARSLFDYAEVLDVMEVEHAQGEMKIWVGEGDNFFSLFYLDGESHARELPDGLRIEATAAWEGANVRIVQKADGGAVLREVFSVMQDGEQIAVIFQLESKLSESPILFRTVYDRMESE